MSKFKALLKEYDSDPVQKSSLEGGHSVRYSVSPLSGDNSVEGDDKDAIFTLTDPAVDKLNAFLGKLGDREYCSPMVPIAHLRSKLSMVGLSFGTPQLNIGEGTTILPLTRFGGRFGKGVSTPHNEFEQDDGISYKTPDGNGLSIQFVSTKLENGGYKVTSKVVGRAIDNT